MNVEFPCDVTTRNGDMGGITGRDWVRIVASGLLAEAVIIAIFVVVALAGGRAAAMYSAVATSFAVCFAFGFWVSKRARSWQ